MKLRIKGNSIRLRLTHDELDRLVRHGRVQDSLHFPEGRRLVYVIEASDQAESLDARFEGDMLTLSMPRSWVASWSDTDRVGFEGTRPLDFADRLHLLIEKDFECLHRRPDDQDAFRHPLAE